MEERKLPDIGTPEECKKKMTDSYVSFLDICCKFIALAEFYSDKANQGRPIGDSFRDSYYSCYKKLKDADSSEFSYQMSFYALLYLTFIDEIKENIDEYRRLLVEVDEELSDYDRCCDYLAVKDEFTDLSNSLKDINTNIAKCREVVSHIGDPDYDPNAKEIIH